MDLCVFFGIRFCVWKGVFISMSPVCGGLFMKIYACLEKNETLI